MFVLDGLRDVQNSKVTIPPFHLGHLGFVPDLEVQCRVGPKDDQGSRELTFVPFQGRRNEIFLLKCVFRDSVGVVLKALTALAALKINILSLESATIDGGQKHVLYCILSWNTTAYTAPIPIDEGAQHKFVRLLPLLHTADARYLMLIEMLFLFCGDVFDHEELEDGAWLPKIQLRPFDALQDVAGSWQRIKVDADRTKASDSRVFFDLSGVHPDIADKVIFFSETDTKTMRMMFVPEERARRFVHVAFDHLSKPGALLAIARLLETLNFNIVTSLLRTGDRDKNVWETMLEWTEPVAEMPSQPAERVAWFRGWAFNTKNQKTTGHLASYMAGYGVEVSRPRYPRTKPVSAEDFSPKEILSNAKLKHPPAPEDIRITQEMFNEGLSKLRDLESDPSWAWLARLTSADVRRRCVQCADYKGTVFVSLPGSCKAHLEIMRAEFVKLGLEVDSYIEADCEDIATEALKRIKRADYFFALWHPDRNYQDQVSPWMPFEYGAARALGKKSAMMFNSGLHLDVKRRIDPQRSWIEYSDLTFAADFGRVLKYCRERWFSGQDGKIDMDGSAKKKRA